MEARLLRAALLRVAPEPVTGPVRYSCNARCGDVAIDVPPIERAGSDAHAEGMMMSYSNLQKMFSTSSVLLHRRREAL